MIFLQKILSSAKEHCCGTLEILCPCSEEELGQLVDFLVSGEIHCENLKESLKIQENLHKILGFPKNLNLSNPDSEKSTLANDTNFREINTNMIEVNNEFLENDIEIMTNAEERSENGSNLATNKTAVVISLNKKKTQSARKDQSEPEIDFDVPTSQYV